MPFQDGPAEGLIRKSASPQDPTVGLRRGGVVLQKTARERETFTTLVPVGFEGAQHRQTLRLHTCTTAMYAPPPTPITGERGQVHYQTIHAVNEGTRRCPQNLKIFLRTTRRQKLSWN